ATTTETSTLSLHDALPICAQAANSVRAQINAASRKRDSLAQQRGELESEHVSLVSANALRPNPSVISPATIPRHPDPGHWLIDRSEEHTSELQSPYDLVCR